jgi:hypothetical protein
MGLEFGQNVDPKQLPVVTLAPVNYPLPRVGHLVCTVNGFSLEHSPDPYSKAVQLISESSGGCTCV